MSLKDKIQEDIKVSLKARDEVRSLTQRMLLAAIINKEKEGNEKVTEEQLQDVVSSEAKKRREAMSIFEKGGRPELAKKEKAELEILLSYLPEQLTEDKIKAIVEEAIKKTKATSIKDMGRVMNELTPQVKGKADGGLVSKIVKEFLM